MSWGEYTGDLIPGAFAELELSFNSINTYADETLMGSLSALTRRDEPLLIIANVDRPSTHSLGGVKRAVLVLSAHGELAWVDDIKLQVMP